MKTFLIIFLLIVYKFDIGWSCNHRVYKCLNGQNAATTEFCGGACRRGWFSCGPCHDRSVYIKHCKDNRPASTHYEMTSIRCNNPNWVPRW
jgi:hypothetical protein